MSKIIIHNGIAKYMFEDDCVLLFEDKQIKTPEFNIGDLNSENSTLMVNVKDVPTDFTGDKYLYDGSWSLNPDYMAPSI